MNSKIIKRSIFKVGMSVEELISEFDDFDSQLKYVVITDTSSSASYAFDEEDIDYIGEELLSRIVMSYETKVKRGSVGLLIEI